MLRLLKNNYLISKKQFKPVRGKRNFSTSQNSGTLNEYDFFPLRAKSHSEVRGIVSADVETMKMEGSTIQLPVLLSLAYYKKGSLIKKLFIIDYKLVSNKGYEYAAKEMWNQFFTYLKTNIPSKTFTIFTHNLGSFDGLFIYKNLIKYSINFSDSDCMIDKDKKFIQIVANVQGSKYTFKDSMRIFNVSLQEFCVAFNVKGKLSNYKSEWNSFSLFDNKKELNIFMEYSLQDSVALLEALTHAQTIYNDHYKVDICSI
jgi:hypothetical protein